MNVDEPGAGYAEELATELKWQLKHLNISASALAGMLQIGQRTIGQWLNGRNKIPLTFVYSASLVMGVKPGSLFELAEKRLNTDEPMLTTGNPERQEPSTLTPEELRIRSERMLQCVGAELRTQLAERDISVRQIALRLGKAPTNASDWLYGRKALPVHFAYNICSSIDFPIRELIERAEARIDLYPEDADEKSGSEMKSTEYSTHAALQPSEISRRLLALVEIKGLDEASAFEAVREAAQQGNVIIERSDWDAALNGSAAPDHKILDAVATAFGTQIDYLTVEDEAVTARVEAEAALARVAKMAGVKNIAARGASLSPETLRGIASLIDKLPK